MDVLPTALSGLALGVPCRRKEIAREQRDAAGLGQFHHAQVGALRGEAVKPFVGPHGVLLDAEAIGDLLGRKTRSAKLGDGKHGLTVT